MSDYSREIQAFMAANYIFEYDFIALAGILSSGGGKRNSPHQLYRQRSEEGALNVLIERHLMDDDTKFHPIASKDDFSLLNHENVCASHYTKLRWISRNR